MQHYCKCKDTFLLTLTITLAINGIFVCYTGLKLNQPNKLTSNMLLFVSFCYSESRTLEKYCLVLLITYYNVYIYIYINIYIYTCVSLSLRCFCTLSSLSEFHFQRFSVKVCVQCKYKLTLTNINNIATIYIILTVKVYCNCATNKKTTKEDTHNHKLRNQFRKKKSQIL